MQIVRRADLEYDRFIADNPTYLAARPINNQHSPTIGITYADLTSDLTWDPLSVDEIFLVLEGRLKVTSEGQTVVLEPEECAFFNRGSTVTLAPDGARVRYVALYYPTNWRELYGEPSAKYQHEKG